MSYPARRTPRRSRDDTPVYVRKAMAALLRNRSWRAFCPRPAAYDPMPSASYSGAVALSSSPFVPIAGGAVPALSCPRLLAPSALRASAAVGPGVDPRPPVDAAPTP